MICSQCNKEFTQYHHAQKYCSEECTKAKRIEWKKEYFSPEKKKRYRNKPEQKKVTQRYNKLWRKKNINYQKEYYQNLSDDYKAKRKKYFQSYFKDFSRSPATIKRRRAWFKERRKDPVFKLITNLRSRTSFILKRKTLVKKSKLLEILGCSLPELKKHLEKQFKLGMNWDNNTLRGWHVDHIIPLASAKTREEVELLCHYTNLQPLWALENIIKSDKII